MTHFPAGQRRRIRSDHADVRKRRRPEGDTSGRPVVAGLWNQFTLLEQGRIMANLDPSPPPDKPPDAPIDTKAARALLLAEANRKARDELAERARAREAANPGLAERLEREAAERHARGLVRPPPQDPANRSPLTLPAQLPKVWAADLNRMPAIDTDRWLGRVRVAGANRSTGDVLAFTLARIAELLVWKARQDRQGAARITFRALAKLTQCCTETARKAIRLLEQWGLVDTFNVLIRRGDQVVRDANLYVLSGVDQADSPPERQRGQSLAEKIAGRLSTYAAVLGLHRRSWGLNATPASRHAWRRSGRHGPT